MRERLSSPGTDALLWTSDPGPDSQGTPTLAPELTDHESAMPIRVLASVIQRHDRFLVCRRPLHKRHGGLWEFPGGKVKDGETDLEVARRELAEELGVHVTAVRSVEHVLRGADGGWGADLVPPSS